ncbi:MAG: sodium:solute symporter [Bacteroidetes bacterium]|nr:sodium:solute symporter [Bacteroidota bacterium]
MAIIDWIVLIGTIAGIIIYGIWKTRNVNTTQSYLQGDYDLKWWSIGLSIMATQASAITFLSTPGQAYEDGMGFAQFYFGLPLAMVILSVFVLPIYYKLKVYTAYEYLEGRFNLATRTFTAILFLISRGLAAGLTIFAPAIILSTILGWQLNLTILVLGAGVTLYTVSGGTKAVSVTQFHQMVIILVGMFIAAFVLVFQLPDQVSFTDAVRFAGSMNKLQVVDFSWDLSNRYTFWSGMIGGVFLFLSYFGTDQSQVQRYLSGKTLTESRLGLMFNGLLKVPMQFLILFVGILVFVFFQFNRSPLHFNEGNVNAIKKNERYAVQYEALNKEHELLFEKKKEVIHGYINQLKTEQSDKIRKGKDKVNTLMKEEKELREKAAKLIKEAAPSASTKDTDYVFITFIRDFLPVGIVGLLLAVIFSASMSSTSSELSSLATTTVIDIYKRSFVKNQTDQHYLFVSKAFTLLWGAIAVLFALSARLFENLIQAVNIVGSLFYGTILGIFLVGFFLKSVKGKAVFWAAILTELIILIIFYLNETGIPVSIGGKEIVISIGYLWLNLIGCTLVMIVSMILNKILPTFSKKL